MDTATILKQHYKQNIPTLKSGQVVRVSEKIVEGGRERVQVFEGLVIAVKHGSGLNGTFTVRKMALGRFGVEKVFLLHQPSIQKIEILREEKVRRAKLYFMRDKVNKKMKKRKTREVNSVFDLQAFVEDEVEEEQAQEEQENKTTEPTAQEQTPKATEQEEQAQATSEDKGKDQKDARNDEQKPTEQKAEDVKQDAQTQDPTNPQQKLDEKQEAEVEKQAKQEPNEAQGAEKAAEEEIAEKTDKQE